jgi:hypothetical protein
MLERCFPEKYCGKSPAELRRVAAEADLAEAKAKLAREQTKALGQGMVVDLGDDDGLGLAEGITEEDVREASPTPLPGDPT